MNSRRASFAIAAGASMLAAGAVFVWRNFVRRSHFPHGQASAERSGRTQASISANYSPAMLKEAKKTEANGNVVGAVVRSKNALPVQPRGKPHHGHHHHGAKHGALVRHLVPASRPRCELGLPACLEKARDQRVRSGVRASCRKQQASALKAGLDRNTHRSAKKMHKAYMH